MNNSVMEIGKDWQIRASSAGTKKSSSTQNRKDEVVYRYVSMGFYLVIPLLISVFIGSWLDRKFDRSPLFLITFLVIGVISTFYNLYRAVKDLS